MTSPVLRTTLDGDNSLAASDIVDVSRATLDEDDSRVYELEELVEQYNEVASGMSVGSDNSAGPLDLTANHTNCECWKCQSNPDIALDNYKRRRKQTQPRREQCLRKVEINNDRNITNSLYEVLVTNVRSFFPKAQGIQESFCALNWDICFLCETWEDPNKEVFQNKILENLSEISGLEYLGRARKSGRKGGGVAFIYKKSRVKIEPLECGQPPKKFEILFGKVTSLSPQAISTQLAVVAYWPPSMNKREIDKSLDYLQINLDLLTNKYSNCEIIFGADINQVPIKSILTLYPGLSSLNSLPTRGKKNIDVFITTLGNYYKTPSICPEIRVGDLASDHKSIFVAKRQVNEEIPKKRKITFRPSPESKVLEFSEFLHNCTWEYLELMEPEQLAETIDTVLTDGLNLFLPQQTKLIPFNSHPWFDNKLESLCLSKSIEYQKNGRSVKYKELCKRYECQLKEAKSKYRAKNLESTLDAKSARKAFSALKRLSGGNTETSTFLLPGHEHLSNEEIADTFAAFFSEISNEFPPLNLEDLPKRVQNRLMCVDDFSIPQFKEDDILRKLMKMKIPNSSVPGDLPPKILRQVLIELTPPLTRLVNSCLRSGKFPDRYKVETCVVIPKVCPPPQA